jgi:hypothetical protein
VETAPVDTRGMWMADRPHRHTILREAQQHVGGFRVSFSGGSTDKRKSRTWPRGCGGLCFQFRASGSWLAQEPYPRVSINAYLILKSLSRNLYQFPPEVRSSVARPAVRCIWNNITYFCNYLSTVGYELRIHLNRVKTWGD